MVSKGQGFQAAEDLQSTSSHMGNSRYVLQQKQQQQITDFFLYISLYDNTFIGGHEPGKNKLLF